MSGSDVTVTFTNYDIIIIFHIICHSMGRNNRKSLYYMGTILYFCYIFSIL